METTIKGVNYSYQWLFSYQKELPTLICLHGFTGCGKTFLPMFKKAQQYNILVVDLIGHGKTSSWVHPYQYQFESVCEALVLLTVALGLSAFSLFGYSMGARVALGIACMFPTKVEKLILESGSPGLATEAERLQRRKSDQQLAQFISEHSLETFVNKWENLSLFATQKKLQLAIQAGVREERLQQQKFGLICSLWFMGTGVQPSYWSKLVQLATIPTLVIVGALDSKFVAIGEKMQHSQPEMTLVIVANAGHCVHLEQPKIVAELVTKKMLEGEDC